MSITDEQVSLNRIEDKLDRMLDKQTETATTVAVHLNHENAHGLSTFRSSVIKLGAILGVIVFLASIFGPRLLQLVWPLR